MPVRKADATWTGTLKEGAGTLAVESGTFEDVPFDWRSRFESGPKTNPEELIGAAHAGCYSMALSGALTRAEHPPQSIRTTASVVLEAGAGGANITRIDLVTRAKVPGIDAAKFAEIAEATKTGCPVSKALKSVEITLDAALE